MKNLKVFIFNQNWFHLGSLLESINVYGSNFKNIDIYFFNHNLIVKPLNLHFDFPASRYFKNRPEKILEEYLEARFLRSNTNLSFHYPKLQKKIKKDDSLVNVSSLSEFKTLKWEKTNIGMAVLSFLVMLSKSSEPNIKVYKKLIINLFHTYFQIFEFLNLLSIDKSKDEFWVCNGRPFHDRVIVEFATKKKIPLKFFEIGGEGSNQDRWILHNNSPHNRVKHQQAIRDHYELTQPRKSIIDNWYKSQKRGGINAFSKNFSPSSNFIKSNNLFVFFSSSDDEVSAISLDWESSWGDQLSAVRFLISYFERNPNLNLAIRIHPNQKNKAKIDRINWKSLKTNSSNIQIYNYDSNVDSYQLLDMAKGILTFGSTIGVEAAYLRKPGALLSKSRWDIIIPHKYIKSERALTNWISSIIYEKSFRKADLDKAYKGSLMWGHYMVSAGMPWKIIVRKKDFRSVNVGYLEGRSLKPSLAIVSVTKFVRFLRLRFIETRFI